MISIWGIPFIVWGIFGDGVNSLYNLIYTTFVCTIYGVEFSLTKNGSFHYQSMYIFVIPCPLTVHKTQIFEKNCANLIEFVKL